MNLADLTTFRLGGPAGDYTEVRTRDALLDFLRDHPLTEASHGTSEVLFVAGGSNLLVSDEGFAGPVCRIATHGVRVEDASSAEDGEVLVSAEAGHPWDDFVAFCVEESLAGVEPLSGIPGSVGATPVQNVGAYGAEVAETLESVTVFDRLAGSVLTLTKAELGFGYRDSILKRSAARLGGVRYVVLEVTFRLVRSELSAPVHFAQLARALDVELGTRVDIGQVREHVLSLRASKGMVLDAADHDTWSAGSFFTNPIVDADVELPAEAPVFAVADPVTGAPVPGVKKTSAAWLIDHAGFGKGFSIGTGAASLSTKHTLALTNRGSALTSEVLDLARHIRDGVRAAFGVELVPEPNLVGCAL